MSRANPDLQKVTLNLRQGDFDYLASICNHRGIPTSALVRNIISNKVDELRAAEGGMPKFNLESSI